jgi:hypothetical protein
MKTLIAGIILIGGFFFLVALGSIWTGYAISVIWGWYVVKIFGLPYLPIPAAIGISALISCFKTHRPNEEGKESTTFWLELLAPAFALAIAWVAKHWL